VGKIIAVTNQKGGVAKTTSSYNLATIAARKGNKTLLVDFDSQASLTVAMGYNELDFTTNIATLMDNYIAKPKHKIPIIECIYESDIENLYFIPSSIDLAIKEAQINGILSQETILKRILKDAVDDFDYIFIDTLPSLGNLTINAMSAADYILVPTEADYLAYKAINSLMDAIGTIQEHINPKLKVLGVFITKYEPTNVAKEVMEAYKEKYTFLGTVQKSVEISDSIKKGQPIVEVKKLNKPGKSIVDSYNSIFELLSKTIEEDR